MNDSNDAASTTPSRSLGDRLWELSLWIPYLGWSGLIAWGLSHRMGWVFALLLAPVLGVVAWFVTGQIANSGTGNLVEINIGSGLLLAYVGVIALCGIGGRFLTRHERRQESCQANLHRQSQALLLYAADFDDTPPPPHRWADAAGLPDKTLRCPESSAPFGYAFSGDAQVLPEKWRDRIDTTMVYEADARVRNASDLQPVARHDGRDGRGTNVLFGDGRVRFVPTPAPRGPVTVGAR